MKSNKLTRKKIAYCCAFSLYVICYYISAYYNYKIFDIEYIALAVIMAVTGIDIISNPTNTALNKKLYFSETMQIIYMTIILAGISLFFQLIHFHLFPGMVKQLIYLAFPCITAFLLNNNKSKYMETYFTITLVCSIAYFLIKHSSNLSLSAISTISFVDSHSPFESSTTSFADIFFYCTIFFAHRKKYFKMLLASFFGILSFKRLIMIGIIVVVIITARNEMRLFVSKNNTKYVSKSWMKTVVVVTTLIPLLLNWLLDSNFISVLDELTGININEFVKGRFELLTYLISYQPTNYGLGTVQNWMRNSVIDYLRLAMNLHNDLYRLYYETTIIGLGVYVHTFVKNTHGEIKGFALTVFFLLNLMVSNSTTNFMPMMLYFMLCVEFTPKKHHYINNFYNGLTGEKI